MKTQAAVLVELAQPLEVVELDIPPLKPGQVLVEIHYSGVCHTQVLEARGFRGEDHFLPHCLGHEGSGIVREISPSVTKVKPGDRVILSWIKGSGVDIPGTTYGWNDKRVNAGAITTFARYSVISENRLTQIPPTFPLREASFLGCAVPTGMGVVLNVAQPKPGQSMAIFGVGGIGLCAIAGAAMAGCTPILAIDISGQKEQAARHMGATCFVDASKDDVSEQIRSQCPGGLDFAIEASGHPAVMAQALSCVRPRGGTAVIVGNARYGERVQLDPRELNLGKRMLGTWGGDNVPDRDYPRYVRWLTSGTLTLGPLLSEPYPFLRINDALNDLAEGRRVRPLVDMDHQ